MTINLVEVNEQADLPTFTSSTGTVITLKNKEKLRYTKYYAMVIIKIF